MAAEVNPTIERFPARDHTHTQSDARTDESTGSLLDLTALALAWGSWAWAVTYIVLTLFFVDFHGGETFYAADGAIAVAAAGLLTAVITLAVAAISLPRWRHAAAAMGLLAAISLMLAITSLGLFLIPAAFGFALAALFELMRVRAA